MSTCAEVRGEHLCGGEGNESTCAEVKVGGCSQLTPSVALLPPWSPWVARLGSLPLAPETSAALQSV